MSVPKPPPAPEPRTHVCRKDGERIAEIAKRYGHKTVKAILEANGKLARTRGRKLEGLKKGDRVTIPLPPRDVLRVARLHGERVTLAAKVALADHEIERAKRMAALAEKSHAHVDAWFDRSEDREKRFHAEVSNTAKAVDTAKKVVDLKRTFIKKVHAPYKQGKMGEAELKKAMDDMIKSEMKGKAKDELKKSLYKMLEGSENVAVHAVRAADESFANINKPSFWAKTAAMIASGESWYDAVNYDIAEAHRAQMDKLKIMRRERHRRYREVRRNNVVWMKKCLAWRAEFLGRIARIDAELRQLRDG